MDLENKVTGFQFEPERSISNHKEFYQDSSDEGKRRLTGKIATLVFDASVVSQAIILSGLTCNLMISISIYFCNQTWFQNPSHIWDEARCDSS